MASEQNEFILTAFDPGGTTGVAQFCVDYRAFTRPENKILANVKWWDCRELEGTEFEQLTAAEALIREAQHGEGPFNRRVEAVTEDFDLVQLTGSKENLLSPVRINAVVDWLCHRWVTPLVYQNRNLRTNVTAERLQAFGFESPYRRSGAWSKTGSGKDAFAAMQHGVVRLKRIKKEAIKRPWKLGEGGVANVRWDCACARGKQCDLRHPNNRGNM